MIIPTSLLAQVGLGEEAEVIVEGDALIVRAPAKPVRAGWAEASKLLAQSGDDALVLPEFGNSTDSELSW